MIFLLCSLALAETTSVPMADGTSLATDVWTPTGAGPWPTILRRTPYGRAFDADSVAAVNSLGYALVSQDVRGRGDSEGEFAPFFNDASDGADTVAWITAQSWSDGHLSMYGGSAESIVQFLVAGEGAPGLEAIQPFQGSPDLRRSFYPGGAWRQDLTTGWLDSLGESHAEAALRLNEVDGPFWDPVRLDEDELAQTDAAMLLVGGFFDIFEGEMAGAPAALRASGSDADVWLVLGPWTHGGASEVSQGKVRFPDAVYSDYLTELFELYDWRLKGGPKPSWAPVRYAVSTFSDTGSSASSEWIDADTWPPPETLERLYLGAEGLGAVSDGEPVSLEVDPSSPVPSVGGGNLNSASGVYDQSDVDARDDVFVAATAPREESVTIAGDLSATIWAASATTDADVIVRVEVVPPSGKAWLVADGVRRGRFVQGEDEIRPLTPGEPARFEIDLGPIAVTLPPGHSLQIAISGTLSPRYEVNPGEAVALSEEPTPVESALTIYRDEAHPSSVTVPITDGSIGGLPVSDEPGDTAGEEPADSAEDPVKGTTGCGCASGQTSAARGGWVGLLVGCLIWRRRKSAVQRL